MPVGIGLKQVLLIRASTSDSYHIFKAPAAPEPIATASNDIKEVLKEWNPKLIIIGKPLNMDGSRSEIMKKVENFFNKIKNITDAKCIYVDERLTTFEARDNINKFLLESGDKNFNNEIVDAHAAQILIDNWLENDNTI